MACEPTTIHIGVEGSLLTVESYPPAVWITATLALHWFTDALQEARADGPGPRRREILFAVCCAESYLLEWVRDQVLKCDFERLKTYFPAGARRGVNEKWKEIPSQLRKDGLIPTAPDLGGPHGEEWSRLIDYRDGLVHARASRPEADSLPDQERPIPPTSLLSQMARGWAVRVVIERIKRLHNAIGTPYPPWLIEP